MRRFRMAFALVGALMMLALPGTVAAGSGYTYTVVRNECVQGESSGPFAGPLLPLIKVKLIKPAGWLNGDRFTMSFQLQNKSFGNGWQNRGSAVTYSKAIPDQYAKFSWAKQFLGETGEYGKNRIVVTLRVWDGTTAIAGQTVQSVACFQQ